MDIFNTTKKTGKDGYGLDIGSHSIKFIRLLYEKDSASIAKLSYVKIKDPSSRSSIIEAIKRCVETGNAGIKEFNVAIAGPAVIVRFIELPRMNDNELSNAITFEAEKYIPFGINEVVIDHRVVVPHIGSNKMLVLLVAAKKDHVNDRLKLLQESGISASILDVASIANANAFLMNPRKKARVGVSAVIDIGASATDIDIIDHDILYFTRTFQIGGDEITKAISNKLSMDIRRAEELKMNPAKRADDISEITKPVLYNIIDEIRPSFSYFENQSGKSIERVYLGGGGSRIQNFHNLLRENLEVAVEQWDPSDGMMIEAEVDKSLFASVKDQLGVATGLAFRQQGD
ncbi:MAG: type IV pilus assembly protein PilM [Candidatus Omnitrophica bacterium]|nr:type IV pilus assembly protein PilM [Candidatus Omnitrophota bacterium]